MAYDSPFFKIRKVTMIGNQRLRLEDVSGGSQVMGKNILAVDTGVIARTVERVPIVKRAIVNRQFSTQEIVILIEERQPCAVWQVKDSKYFVDDEGVVFQKIESAPNLPVVTDMDGSRIDLGARLDAGAVQLALQLTERLPSEMGTRVERFEYLRSGGLVVVEEKGQRARFGDVVDFEFKLATWKAILEGTSQAKLKIDHTDLRFGYRPFVR
ncbi:MAG: FtsQ-type POTRA domain-containing protein, partial [Chloroflexota bacterium]